MRFSLRTLVVVLTVGPLFGAGGFWGWQHIRPKESPWNIDGGKDYVVPANKPGFRWKLTRDNGLIEVPDETGR
jgi:hypothetical protein